MINKLVIPTKEMADEFERALQEATPFILKPRSDDTFILTEVPVYLRTEEQAA
jgi:hypothetical protein